MDDNINEELFNRMIPKEMKEKIKGRSELIGAIMNVCDGQPLDEIRICLKMAEERIAERTHYFHVEPYPS